MLMTILWKHGRLDCDVLGKRRTDKYKPLRGAGKHRPDCDVSGRMACVYLSMDTQRSERLQGGSYVYLFLKVAKTFIKRLWFFLTKRGRKGGWTLQNFF